MKNSYSNNSKFALLSELARGSRFVSSFVLESDQECFVYFAWFIPCFGAAKESK